ncbi:MAG TPA: protein translocase subunit SecF [Candidatus Acidoferrum sp.]|jgi:preprotein translocase subunit SecF|nr:protein translocase subunit SecF [Candidatus Acidoferrum sp.]
MNFFKQVDLDWMGKAKYFFGLSFLLLAAGVASILAHGGLFYGIDFKGGTVVDVRFAGPPPIDTLRSGLAAQGIGNSTIVPVSDLTTANGNEVLINLEEKGQGAEALDAGKTAILNALHATLGAGEAGKQDFNAAGADTIAETLTRKDPLALGTAAGDRYNQLARQLAQFRDRDHRGIVTDLGQLSGAGANANVIAALRDSFYTSTFAIINVEIVGPKVGSELRRQAVVVTLYALGGMLVYIAFRFEWVYGAAAVLAVFHDVLITLGLFSIFHFEISLTVIAALLTLVGYSMNDTIVIFDRIRENARLMRREPFKAIVNRSINQTLSRTILTSGLTFLTVLVLFLMGGQVLRAFSFALVVGILVGTYSSFGIAAPLVVAWNQWRGQGAAVVASGTAAGTKLRKT